MENQYSGCPPGKAQNYLYLSIGLTYMQNSNGYTYIFDHARLAWDTDDTVRRWPINRTQNGGIVIGNSFIRHSNPEIQCTSGLQTTTLNSDRWPTSDSVGSITGESSMVENVGVAVGIS